MKILLQLAGIFGLCLICSGISELLPFVFPGSAIAMVLLFLAFLFKLVRVSDVEEVGEFLLKNMAFFFVPPGVALMECFEEMKSAVLPILIICIVSTFVTFAATAYTVRFACYLQRKIKERGKTK